MSPSYRVELWVEGASPDPDRVPDVNRTVRARDPRRAIRAAALAASRAAGEPVTVEDLDVYPEAPTPGGYLNPALDACVRARVYYRLATFDASPGGWRWEG
jgi:hypothetical protein